MKGKRQINLSMSGWSAIKKQIALIGTENIPEIEQMKGEDIQAYWARRIKAAKANRCRTAIERAADNFETNNAENGYAWLVALDAAARKVADEWGADVEGAPKERLVKLEAEEIMLQEFYVPPHWKGSLTCETCGPMPAENGSGERVKHCRWCQHYGAWRTNIHENAA